MKMPNLVLVLVAILAGVSTSTFVRAQQTTPLPIEDALHLVSPRAPIAFSPDGKWLAYTVQSRSDASAAEDQYLSSGVPWWGRGSDIYVVNLGTGDTRNLTASRDDNWLPSWSPDGRYLAFLSDRSRNGQTHLWLWDSLSNNVRCVSDLMIRMRGLDRIEWNSAGSKILVAAIPTDLSLVAYQRQTVAGRAPVREKDREKRSGSTVTTYTAEVNIENGRSDRERLSLIDDLRDLSIIDASTGTVRNIVHNQRIAAFHFLPNGASVAYTRPQWDEEIGSQQVSYDLVVKTVGHVMENVLAVGVALDLAGQFSFSPDGLEFTYRASEPEGGLNVYAVALGDNQPHKLDSARREPHQSYSFVPLWDAQSACVYFISEGSLVRSCVRDSTSAQVAHLLGVQIRQLLGGPNNLLWTDEHAAFTVVVGKDDASQQENFYRIDLTTGAGSKLLESDQCHTCVNSAEGLWAASSAAANSIAFFSEDAQHPADIWIANASFSDLKRLTRLNPKFDKIKMGESRVVDWLSDDGDRLRGALLLPSDYREGQRYPLVVVVYPSAMLSETISHFGGPGFFNVQLLATRGYAVLLPDSPQHLATPLSDVAKTVLPGVNRVVEMGIADSTRLGVMGQSNGGYGTLSLIVTTNRFKAAVEVSGPGDLIGLYGEMDKDGTALGNALERSIDKLGGSPWEYRDRYIENSPLFYLDRVKTPLLIVHGAQDNVVASFLGDELFVALRRLGKSVEYDKYEGEGHDITREANRIDFMNRTFTWFDRLLKGKNGFQN